MIKASIATVRQGGIKSFLSLLIGLIILVAGIWLWGFLQNPNKFPIKEVNVSGEYSHVSHSKIQNIISPLVNQSLFTVDIKQIRAELLQLPWIASVQVTRMWPSELMITLQEKRPVAVWNHKHLLTASAQVFTPNVLVAAQGLPQLHGPDDQQQLMLKKYKAINELLAQHGLTIVQLDLTSDMLWRMKLNNGMDVMIGADHILQRVQRFMTAYNEIFSDKRQAKYIDLRYPSGLAVRWNKT